MGSCASTGISQTTSPVRSIEVQTRKNKESSNISYTTMGPTRFAETDEICCIPPTNLNFFNDNNMLEGRTIFDLGYGKLYFLKLFN